MAFMPDAVKNALDDAIAKVQGEVGRFLMLKEKIRALPDGLIRQDLILQQDILEKTALTLVAKGQSLKSSLDSFNPFDIKQVASLGPKVQSAISLTQDGAALVEAIQVHKARVISAVGSSADFGPVPSASSPARGSLGEKVMLGALLLVPLGFFIAPGVAMWLRGRRR